MMENDKNNKSSLPVSYTHLDVYKRQGQGYAGKVLRRQCIREKRGQYS